MAAHFCWFWKLLFSLLLLARAPTIDTRPASGTPPSALIAGNEFLKLFLERDELQRDLHSGEYQGSGAVSVDVGESQSAGQLDNGDTNAPNDAAAVTAASVRSFGHRSRNEKRDTNAVDDGKQVVQLVTSGSKIVFLEEYDDNDAVVDAVAREIDLQKDPVRKSQVEQKNQRQQRQQSEQKQQANPSDEVKVVAVSVSSSSKRGSAQATRRQAHKFAESSSPQADTMRQAHKTASQPLDSSTLSTFKVTAAKEQRTLTTTAAPTTSTRGDFVNRSHKSEFSIEEAEPLTMSQRHGARAISSGDTLDEVDSENSASTNVHNVLAAPLVQSASTRSSSTVAVAYHSGKRNASTSTHINHSASGAHAHGSTHDTSAQAMDAVVAEPAGDMEDKLLPFQTVIYHDTKEGHGPQSRSISYSSISQNVDDLHRWRHSGILAEAQRNVSESLKPAPHTGTAATAAAGGGGGSGGSGGVAPVHTSEPAKFYSVPAKMYGEPAKFYSEPAKVYSEPSKVYGEPEKFYSEPAKVYGQPSKFYSEPSKVYSQPSKVYGEPAKTYWPNAATATTSTSSSISTASTTSTTTSTTTAPLHKAPGYATRRPAVVSRIAFGEAHTTTVAPTNFDNQPPTATHFQSHRQHGQAHSHINFHGHNNPSANSASTSTSQSQSRRVLFNLDKLPYDLLNAPVQSSKHLLDPDFSSSPPAAVTYSSPRQRQCLESAFSASLSQSATQQQQLLLQQRQHSSLSDQHSNQNAKGLPNRELVKCVSKYSPPATPATPAAPIHHSPQHTTESSHIADVYTPTPEQNYEIEESVSVMTNGRAHGVQGIHGPTTTTTASKTAAARPTKLPTRVHFGTAGGRGGAHYHTNANTNANANANANVHSVDHNYDDDEAAAVDEGAAVGAAGDGELDDDADDAAAGNKSSQGDDDDDAKVAYVVEGRNYRKYRVEEKTDDGFIVGEYGVVDHNDGNLRGVRYTADSTINRSLIQKALLTFLKLK